MKEDLVRTSFIYNIYKVTGVDPQPETFGNQSGEALKFMYALLELKAGLMETEFRLGFGEFVRAICHYLNLSCETIDQTWTRTSIKNDNEISYAEAKKLLQKNELKEFHWTVEEYIQYGKKMQSIKMDKAIRKCFG